MFLWSEWMRSPATVWNDTFCTGTDAVSQMIKQLRDELEEERKELWTRNARRVEDLITRPLRKVPVTVCHAEK